MHLYTMGVIKMNGPIGLGTKMNLVGFDCLSSGSPRTVGVQQTLLAKRLFS